MLARAIILGPDVLVADEPVSMLDMSVRAKILELMIELKSELDLTYIYITHDLATAKFFCDRIAIMYLGRIVELGPAEEIYADPKHPYTQSLLRAIPEPDPRRTVPRDLPRGEIPDAVSPPLGCRFHPRCPKAFEVCGWESRDLRVAARGPLDQAPRGGVRARARADRRPRRARPADLRLPAPRRRRASRRGRRRVLAAMRSAAPDDPLWTGIAETEVVEDGVEVEFNHGAEPRRLEVDGVEVECHLHDPEAIEAAKRAAHGGRPDDASSVRTD